MSRKTRRDTPKQAFWRFFAEILKKLTTEYRYHERRGVAGILILESGLPFEEWCSQNAAANEARARHATDMDQGTILDQVLRDARLLAKQENPNLSEVKRVLTQLRGMSDLLCLLTNPDTEGLPEGLGPSTSEEDRRWATSSRRNLLKAHNILLRRSGVNITDFQAKKVAGRNPVAVTPMESRRVFEDAYARVKRLSARDRCAKPEEFLSRLRTEFPKIRSGFWMLRDPMEWASMHPRELAEILTVRLLENKLERRTLQAHLREEPRET